jgi:hypothetical protein
VSCVPPHIRHELHVLDLRAEMLFQVFHENLDSAGFTKLDCLQFLHIGEVLIGVSEVSEEVGAAGALGCVFWLVKFLFHLSDIIAPLDIINRAFRAF